MFFLVFLQNYRHLSEKLFFRQSNPQESDRIRVVLHFSEPIYCNRHFKSDL